MQIISPDVHSDVCTALTATDFASLGLPAALIAAAAARGIEQPFPIQAMTIPHALAGRDVCGQAETGSGKTLAFGLPLVCRVPPAAPGKASALVLVPTRELAAQVEGELRWMGAPFGHRVVGVYGGASMSKQREEMALGAEIVVSTPGRLIDLIGRGDVDLGTVAILVLDEADRMCDMGFMPPVEWLLRRMPTARQTMLFSATLGSDVNFLVKNYLCDPVRHGLEVPAATVAESHHRFLRIHDLDRVKVISSIVGTAERALVFVNTKRGCDRLTQDLQAADVLARAIHGDLDQTRRTRALRQFTTGQVRVLVATDVAARGLHIDGVDMVIQAELPDDHKTYLHRAGRTARAGASGLVVTLILWNQVMEAEKLQRRLGLRVPIPEVFSNDPRLQDLMAWDPASAA